MTVLILLVGLLPASGLKNALLRMLGRGWSIDRSARIQPVLLWRVRRLCAGPNAYIGPGTVVRDLELLDLDENAEIGQFNWISAAAEGITALDESKRASLVMEAGSGITSRHYIDCSGGLHLEHTAMIGGVRSTILSHSINPHTWLQEGRPIRIGRSSLVLTNVVLTAGSTLAPDCLVAAGAVVTGDLSVSGRLYGGVPAKEIADVSSSAYAGRATNTLADRPAGRTFLAAARRAPR